MDRRGAVSYADVSLDCHPWLTAGERSAGVKVPICWAELTTAELMDLITLAAQEELKRWEEKTADARRCTHRPTIDPGVTQVGVPIAGVQKPTIRTFTVKGEEENEGLLPQIP
jgi:hypothetical protein